MTPWRRSFSHSSPNTSPLSFPAAAGNSCVETIVHGTPAEMAQLERQIASETTDSARRLGFGETVLDEDEPKFLVRLFGGEKVSAGETWQLVKGRV